MLVGDLYSLTPSGSVPFQPGPVMAYVWAGAGGALARDLEHVGPAVQHRHQVVAVLHVRQAEHPGLLGDVQPGQGVERVGVGGRDVLERRRSDTPAVWRTGPSGRAVPSGSATLVMTRRVISIVTSG